MMHTACWVSHIIDVTDNVAILTVLCAGYKPSFQKTRSHNGVDTVLPIYLEPTPATEDDVGPVSDVMI